MKQTLTQIRASSALDASRVNGIGEGKAGGDTISGFPMLIRVDGLLVALAFAVEEKHREGQTIFKHAGAEKIATQLALHLRKPTVAITHAESAKDLVTELAAADAATLRRATAEALAWCSFLKRFVA